MHFGWTEEETMWRRSMRGFAQKKIAPRVREIDSNNRIPDDVVKGMTDMGLWAPTVSEAYGGQGMNVTMATIAAEEVGPWRSAWRCRYGTWWRRAGASSLTATPHRR